MALPIRRSETSSTKALSSVRTAMLLHDQRGSVTVEYTIVLCLVSLGASLAIIALGSVLLHLFRFQQALLALPFP